MVRRPACIEIWRRFSPAYELFEQRTEGELWSFWLYGKLYGQRIFRSPAGLPFPSMRLNPLVGRTQLDSELGMFVQDTFKVNSRLTLDFGLRWERFGAPNYEDGLIYNWNPATGDVIVPGSVMDSVSPLYPTNQINVIAGNAQQTPSLHNFAPRIGIAYRPFGSDFVIRGGLEFSQKHSARSRARRARALIRLVKPSSTQFKTGNLYLHSRIHFREEAAPLPLSQ